MQKDLIKPIEQSIHFQLPHIKLAARRWGATDAPIILAVHGWLDNSESFAPLAPYLVSAGYQVIALEWPGHGHSDHRPLGVEYHLLDYLFDLHCVVQQLPCRPYILGHSMGGIIATLYAGVMSDEMMGLISIEAAGPITAKPVNAPMMLQKNLLERSKATTQHKPYTDLSHLIRARAKSGHFSEALAERLIDRNLKHDSTGYTWRSDPRLRKLSAWMMVEQQALSCLSEITIPMLIILAEQGFESIRDKWQQRQAIFKTAQYVEMAGGHHCHMEYPAQAARLILQQWPLK